MRTSLSVVGPRPATTVGMLVLTWVASAFGNSLQPISILVWLYPLALLISFDRAVRSFRSTTLAYVVIIAVQALGTAFGMSGLLSYPRVTPASLAAVLGLGVVLAVAHTFGALLPAACLCRAASDHLASNMAAASPHNPPPFPLGGRALLGLSLWAYPILSSGVRTLVGQALAHDHEPGVAVADWPAVAQLASLVGLWGVNFLVDLAGAAAFALLTAEEGSPADVGGDGGDEGLAADDSDVSTAEAQGRGARQRLRRPLRRHAYGVAALLGLAAAVGGGLVHRGTFYQQPVTELVARQRRLAASCVVGQSVRPASEGYLWLWQKTAERVAAGDHIVLWSEESVDVRGDEEEEALLAAGRELLAVHGGAAAGGGGALLGLCYQKWGGDLPQGRSSNHFVLLGPNGSTLWDYRKAYPVPLVEAQVVAGPARLPLAPSPYGLLAGGICFDLDRPQYVRAAGAAGADLLLQPSWTWGDVGPRHFAANALRALENGLTLLRCSSSGVSGVVSPRGTLMHWLPTGERDLLTMVVPLEPHLPTLYARGGGWALEWANLAATGLLWAAALVLCWRRARRLQLGGGGGGGGGWVGEQGNAEGGAGVSSPLLGSAAAGTGEGRA